MPDGAVDRAARNLLFACAGARPGETLLILHENARHGYFDAALAPTVAAAAGRLGLRVETIEVPFDPDATELPEDLRDTVARADHALFLARLGDQLRFKAMPEGSRPIVSYVLDEPAFASPFASADYGAMKALSAAIDRHLTAAEEIRVTCPLGTDFAGRLAPPADGAGTVAPVDTSIKRFPHSVHRPLDARGFAGRVAVAHMLCGTGSRYYEPYGIPLAGPVFAQIEGGRLRGWSGPPAEVRRVEDHVAAVAARFGIDGAVVHSWHAGIHPGCRYPGSAHDHYERWSGSAFGNPRLLHFHTCGDYAPGEICWNVVDPTVTIDGIAVWHDGRLETGAIPGAAEILAAHPDLAALYADPERAIGLGVAA